MWQKQDFLLTTRMPLRIDDPLRLLFTWVHL
jgi:hypothetical protein